MGATVIVDAFWGDSGKGKVSAWLARSLGATFAVRAGIGTNAGASVILPDDTVIKQRQLPTAWMNGFARVAVGSGVLVNPEVFLAEVAEFGLEGRAFVDGRCPVILPEHIAAEQGDANLAERVGSTKTGNGFARADFVLRRTVLGRNMYATGGNQDVARLVGINTAAYKIGAFILIGVLAAIAGMFVMADLAAGTTSIGSGWELAVIAGVVVGGVSLFGGAGTIAGGLSGVLLLQVVQSGLVVIGVNANWQQIAVGIIMVLAVGLDILRRRFFIAGSGRREETIPSEAQPQTEAPAP